MYIKALNTALILTLLFFHFSLKAMPDETEVRERKYCAIRNLPDYKQRKLNTFLSDPTTHGPVLLFLDYFDIHHPGYGEEVNYLSDFLDLLDEKTDLGERSSLVFYTPEVYKACLPKESSEFTPAFCQFGVCKTVGKSLSILRGLAPGDFQKVSQYVRQHLDIFTTGRSIYHFLMWYKILHPEYRLETLNLMYTKFQNWIPYANCPFSSEEYLYRRLAQLNNAFIRDLILLRILTNAPVEKFHGVNREYVDLVISEIVP